MKLNVEQKTHSGDRGGVSLLVEVVLIFFLKAVF